MGVRAGGAGESVACSDDLAAKQRLTQRDRCVANCAGSQPESRGTTEGVPAQHHLFHGEPAHRRREVPCMHCTALYCTALHCSALFRCESLPHAMATCRHHMPW